MIDSLLGKLNIDTPKKKKRLLFLAAALVLGTTFTLITYPGIFYSDSYGRLSMAREMSRGNMALQDDWLSVPPQLFMTVLYKLTQSYAGFTLLQSVLFFFTAFCAVDFFCPRGGLVAGLLFCCCPIFYGFSVYVEMSVGCVVALLWLLMLLLGTDYEAAKRWTRVKKILYFLACFFLYFVMLGFRQNAFTVLPVLALVLFLAWRKSKNWLPAVLNGVAVALSLVLISALPSLLNFGIRNGSGSMSTGFLWETVSMLETLAEQEEYAHMLDYLGEEGTTQKAAENNHRDSIYGYHPYIPNSVVGQGGNAAQIRRDYFYLMWNEPGTYWRVKGEFAAYTLGISQPLMTGEYDYNFDDRMDEFGYRDTERRQQFHGSYHSFQESFSVFRRPWVIFAITLALLLPARWALKKKEFANLCAVYASAVFFYASFLVTTQSQEFRYFFAPLVLLYMVAAAALGALCGKGWDALKRHMKEKRGKKRIEGK